MQVKHSKYKNTGIIFELLVRQVTNDVLATGGTAEAVCKMVESLGGQIVQCNFIIKLDFLEGAKKLAPHSIYAAISY